MNANAVLLIVIVIALYLIACRVWPYTTCGRCDGGKHLSPTGKAWRHCPRCGGTGRRRRVFAPKP